jgi:hypothetical protein
VGTGNPSACAAVNLEVCNCKCNCKEGSVDPIIRSRTVVIVTRDNTV